MVPYITPWKLLIISTGVVNLRKSIQRAHRLSTLGLKMDQVFFVSQLVAAILLISSVHGELKPPICLTGNYHKVKPGPETVDYRACHAYKESTCCTADFTKQIEASPLKKIGNFSWISCSPTGFSKKCEEFMKEVECFYQCSPNVGYWKGTFRGSFVGVPICSSFCDAWFDACKDEKTCAKSWITDFDYDSSGNNKCKPSSACRSFSDVYGNGTGLCHGMWGNSFKYTVSKTPNDCMHLSGVNNGSNPDVLKNNVKVAEKYFSISSDAPGMYTPRGCALLLLCLVFVVAQLL